MIIAIDYDNTFSRDPETFRKVMDAFHASGHTCVMITSRGDDWWGNKVREAIGSIIPIVFAAGAWKRVAAKHAGYKVDIWIDDMPEYVGAQDVNNTIYNEQKTALLLDDADRERVIDIAEYVGVIVDESTERGKDEFSWNGQSIRSKRLSTQDLAHEIAHWIIAPIEHRHHCDFGMSDIPIGRRVLPNGSTVSILLPEEYQVALLGHAIEIECGGDVRNRLLAGTWIGPIDKGAANEFWPAIHALTQRGLLAGHRPTCALSMKETKVASKVH